MSRIYTSLVLLNAIENCTAGGFVEAQSNTCQIQWYEARNAYNSTCSYHIPRRAAVTEKVAEYLVYKVQYEKAGQKEDIPDFIERIDPELVLEMYVRSSLLT